ncbi:conserved hypothetical protein [Ricinus communis]|uniref:Uncharacterized protein n=1 Tax=Ricinus communis TaxID=3988 RepID=B9RXC2_RICCO|nr:conserved hypothetical protein [Ricinus communis]
MEVTQPSLGKEIDAILESLGDMTEEGGLDLNRKVRYVATDIDKSVKERFNTTTSTNDQGKDTEVAGGVEKNEDADVKNLCAEEDPDLIECKFQRARRALQESKKKKKELEE